MARKHQHGTPLILSSDQNQSSARPLHRLTFSKEEIKGKAYDEAWLQRLIHIHPTVLPIYDLEPALAAAIPVCMEVPTPAGYIDNLFVTPFGDLIVTECKLWRNPEARRQAVVQIVDYAQALARWTYEDLEAAIANGLLPDGSKLNRKLYDLVPESERIEESEFIDAVSTNLRRGRMLLLIVGDGIREGAESLVKFLQAHAGLHFSLGLVELAIYEDPERSTLLIHPRVTARTQNIERGIVRILDGQLVVEAPEMGIASRRESLPSTITEDHFFEALGNINSTLPKRLRIFLSRLDPWGVTPEFKRSLILRWEAPDGTRFNLGYILLNGDFWTDMLSERAIQVGFPDIGRQYLQELADAVGGSIRDPKNGNSYLIVNGEAPKIGILLSNEDACLNAIERFTKEMAHAIDVAET